MADRAGRRVAGGVGRHALGLEGEEQPDEAIGERQDQSAVVEGAVVAGVGADVALVQVDVVDAMQPSVLPNSASIGLCRFCVELGAEREDLAAGGLALLEIQRQQVLQIVGAGRAGRRQHAAERQSNSGALT